MRRLILATVAMASLLGLTAPHASAAYHDGNRTGWSREHRVDRQSFYDRHHQRWHHRKWEHGHWRYYN